jgi:hypothetical protein
MTDEIKKIVNDITKPLKKKIKELEIEMKNIKSQLNITTKKANQSHNPRIGSKH